MIGKGLKYSCWTAFAIFLYHWALIKKYENPEQAVVCLGPFLQAAKLVDWTIYDFGVLMTKPGMTKMLPDRLNIPGQGHPKCLVVNLNGTLIHQTY